MNRYVPIPSKYNSISIPILCIQPTDLKQSSMYLLSVGEFKYDSSLGIFYDVSSNENLTLDKNELKGPL